MKPLILIDVDGVLNPDFSAKTRKHLVWHKGWVIVHADVDGYTYRLTLNPEHGDWLKTLAAETGAELAWGSTWENYANTHIGPVLGLPELPWAPAPRGSKAHGVIPWTQGRPFVWFDDDPLVKRDCSGVDQPHLIVEVDERAGLTQAHVEQARDWLKARDWTLLGCTPPDSGSVPKYFNCP